MTALWGCLYAVVIITAWLMACGGGGKVKVPDYSRMSKADERAWRAQAARKNLRAKSRKGGGFARSRGAVRPDATTSDA